MNKSVQLPVIIIFLTSVTFISGCSVFHEPNRQFNNELTGAVEIAQDLFSDEKESTTCESKHKKEKLACQKQIDALVQSIKKSNNDEHK